MLRKIGLWYRMQPNKIKLLVIFICNSIWWLFVQYITEVIFPDDKPKSFRSFLFGGLFMGVLWTLLFSWKFVKATFKKTPLLDKDNFTNNN
ncbi:MAG TPA: hypothetical protein VM888_12845 [Chitinophagaceae bacterium]|nr:hypothetical protein [Chitinophagaceae bacterium]